MAWWDFLPRAFGELNICWYFVAWWVTRDMFYQHIGPFHYVYKLHVYSVVEYRWSTEQIKDIPISFLYYSHSVNVMFSRMSSFRSHYVSIILFIWNNIYCRYLFINMTVVNGDTSGKYMCSIWLYMLCTINIYVYMYSILYWRCTSAKI